MIPLIAWRMGAELGARAVARRAMSAAAATLPPVQAALPLAFAALPPVLRAVHGLATGTSVTYAGKATVSGDDGMIARLVRASCGLPEPSSTPQPALFTITRSSPHEEAWQRRIGARTSATRLLRRDETPWTGVVIEKLPAFPASLADVKIQVSVPTPDTLAMAMQGISLGPLPMPGFLRPVATVTERVATDGSTWLFGFSLQAPVPFRDPLLVCKYEAVLTLQPDAAAEAAGATASAAAAEAAASAARHRQHNRSRDSASNSNAGPAPGGAGARYQ